MSTSTVEVLLFNNPKNFWILMHIRNIPLVKGGNSKKNLSLVQTPLGLLFP
jgi:hypothetical protein